MENIILRNGDCLEIMKEIDDKSIDLILMDPPYNIGKSKEWDKWETKEKYIEFMGEVFKECERILKYNGSMYFFHNDMVQISMLMEWLRNNSDFRFNSFLIWEKQNFYTKCWKNNSGGCTLRSFFNICEYCLYYTKGEQEDVYGNYKTLRQYVYELAKFIGGGYSTDRKRI